MPNAAELLTSKSPLGSVEVSGVTFRIKRLDLNERFKVFEKIKQGRSSPEFMAQVLVSCVCDESGKPLLSEDQISQIVGSDSEYILPVLEYALQYNGLTDTKKEEAKKN